MKPALAIICAWLLGAFLVAHVGFVSAQLDPDQVKQTQAQGAGPFRQQRSADPERSADLDRGKYLVHHVAMCVECHTPRSSDGVLNEQRLLQGAPIPLKSPFSGQEWALRAPRLAGLPGGWSETELTHFLQTGERPDGRAVRAPMPRFRLTEQDATDVAAYVVSLEQR